MVRLQVILQLGACLLSMQALAAAGDDVPQNGWVVWGSNREDSRHEIYLMKSDGTGIKRLTYDGGERAAWSPDGRWIAYTRPSDYTTHVVRPDGSGGRQICDEIFRFWMWGDGGVVCGWKTFKRVSPNGEEEVLVKQSDFLHLADTAFAPSGITHDGRWMVGYTTLFKDRYEATNGTYKHNHAAIVLDLEDTTKLYLFGGGCEPTTPPVGNMLYHVCGMPEVCHKPDIYRMTIDDITKEPSVNPDSGLHDVTDRPWYKAEISHEEADWGHEYFPRVSNDNEWIVYGASTGCHDHLTCDYEIFIHRRGSDITSRTRLTHDPNNDQWPDVWIGTLPEPDYEWGEETQTVIEPGVDGEKNGCMIGGRAESELPAVVLLIAVLLCARGRRSLS